MVHAPPGWLGPPGPPGHPCSRTRDSSYAEGAVSDVETITISLWPCARAYTLAGAAREPAASTQMER